MGSALAIKKYVGLTVIALFFSVLGTLVFVQTSHARPQSPDDASARAEVERVCGAYPAAFASYVDDVSLDYNTGVASYRVNILYKSCGTTFAFAVVGQPGIREVLCPMVGQYGGGNTYDCMKFTGDTRFEGYSGLSCAAGTNEACINTEFSRIERPSNQAGGTVDKLELRMSTQIPNWAVIKTTSGEYPYGMPNALCAYYKLSDGSPQNPPELCQDVYFKVSWTAPWTISGESYIKNAGKNTARPDANNLQRGVTAAPGDRLHWFHDLRNNPQSGSRTSAVSYQVDKSGFTNGWNGTTDPNGTASGAPDELFVRQYASNGTPKLSYTVTQDDVGRVDGRGQPVKLCQNISWTPGSGSNGGRFYSNSACATVPYNYEITPTVVDVVDGSQINSQGQLSVTGSLENTGPTKSRPNLQWQLSQVVYAPNVASPKYDDPAVGGEPCAYLRSISRPKNCNLIGASTIAEGLTVDKKTYPGGGFVEDEPVGTQICFVMSVRQYNATAENWRHSTVKCRIVSKSPKVQIRGGDTIVGKGSSSSRIATSVTRKKDGSTDRYYGSWGEYAVTATGPIYGMSSGAGYAAADGSIETDRCQLNYLTITNAGSSTCDSSTKQGFYSFGATLPPIGDRFSGGSDRGTDPTIDVATQRGIVTGKGTITLRASRDVPAGNWVVINAPDANVVIKSDIRYTDGSLTGIDQIPQVIIIANNISIDGGVTRTDAWLVASGTSGRISTCSEIAKFSDLNAKTCDRPLTVNGPVAARKLFLYRTAGSGVDNASGEPAEVFNLRPDAYLWAANYAGSNNRIQTSTTKDLPPRF